MNNTTWVYTTVDPMKLVISAMYMSPRQYETIKTFQLIAPARLEKQLRTITDTILPNWNVGFTSDESLDELAPSVNMLAYSLRAKLLYPLALNGPFLFTDDDVIVTKNIDPVLDKGPFWSGMGFDRLNPKNSRDDTELEILNEVFGTRMGRDEYNANHTDSAVVHYDIHANDRSLYSSLLQDYFTHPLNVEILKERYVHRKRYRDQRFQTMWLTQFETPNGRDMTDVAFWAQAPEKRSPKIGLPSKTFVHYCATTHKPWYMAYLLELVDAHRERMGWDPINQSAALQLAEGGNR